MGSSLALNTFGLNGFDGERGCFESSVGLVAA
jgi:hypothetical protein